MEQHQKPSKSKENCINYFLLAVTHTIDDAFKAKQKLKTVWVRDYSAPVCLRQDITAIYLKKGTKFGDR